MKNNADFDFRFENMDDIYIVVFVNRSLFHVLQDTTLFYIVGGVNEVPIVSSCYCDVLVHGNCGPTSFLIMCTLAKSTGSSLELESKV